MRVHKALSHLNLNILGDICWYCFTSHIYIYRAVVRAIQPVQSTGAPDPRGPHGASRGVLLGPPEGEGKKGEKEKKKKIKRGENEKKKKKREKQHPL